jgi:hypothetical protein
MGRYAFFNTKFEYKFRFGVQASSDIRTFGGYQTYESYEDGYFNHKWTDKDTDSILSQLQSLCEYLGEVIPTFKNYTKSLEGTHKLLGDLYKLYDEIQAEELVARFILGCCIYHQLLYKKELEVQYEA